LLCEAIRLRGRDVRVVIDGVEALTYLLPHDQPIHSFSLEVDGDKRTVGQASFDEVCVEPFFAGMTGRTVVGTRDLQPLHRAVGRPRSSSSTTIGPGFTG
jgi:hypothetical protein